MSINTKKVKKVVQIFQKSIRGLKWKREGMGQGLIYRGGSICGKMKSPIATFFTMESKEYARKNIFL